MPIVGVILSMDATIWPLATAMFTTGLLGGMSHCAGMCGPFVLAQVSARGAVAPNVPDGGALAMGGPPVMLARLRGAMLLPYHLGRITTYAFLGGMAAATGGTAVRATGFHWLLILALGLATLLFLRQGLMGLGEFWPLLRRLTGGGGEGRAGGVGARLGAALAAPLRPLFAQPTGINGLALGMALGFLPCGLLYAALASAMGIGDPVAGIAMMAGFGAGTLPALWLIGIIGQTASQQWRRLARLLMPPLMFFNAFMVARMAAHLWGG